MTSSVERSIIGRKGASVPANDDASDGGGAPGNETDDVDDESDCDNGDGDDDEDVVSDDDDNDSNDEDNEVDADVDSSSVLFGLKEVDDIEVLDGRLVVGVVVFERS